MKRSGRRVAVGLVVLVGTAAAVWAETAPAKPDGKGRFDELKFRSIGPSVGGRVARAVGIPDDPSTYYAATAQGGVWKSEDGGRSWDPIFDSEPVASIGSIAVAPSDVNVVYVGTGEANIRGNVIAGQGIFRSTDAGKTWKQVWKQTGQIGAVAIDPSDSDIAYAAVLGHAFGPNPERGVYRTRDGGETWERVLYKDENTGASDVAIDPTNSRILFAGLWQARRYPWDLESGGPGSGLYRSTDGGDTWKQLTGKGLPGGIWGKVGVAVAPSDPRRVYALIEADDGGLFRSDDGGDTWAHVNDQKALRQRAWYYSTLTVDPANADVVWFPQVNLLKTIDGGKTIQSVGGYAHGDMHDCWIDSYDTQRLIVANDGGVEISVNGGESWYRPPMPTAQFYNVDADSREPMHVGGTMQDEGTVSGPSNSLRSEGITLTDWLWSGGGEAGDFVYDVADPDIVYAGEYGGIITVHDAKSGSERNVSAYPTDPSGHGGEDLKVRFQWTAPIAVDPHDPTALYHGANVLFRSHDRGRTWQQISPDLTRNDKSKQRWAGGPITGDNTGVEVYDTIFSIAIEPQERGVIWAGSDDGLVHVTRDDGKSWQNVTPKGVPEWGTVECIEASPHAAGTAWVVVDAHRLDDPHPYLFRTTDYGKSWQNLSAGLPEDAFLMVVREDPARAGLIYAGNETGVYVSWDDGKSWTRIEGALPPVEVTDLQIRGDSLLVGTSGRSLWMLDDLSALRQWRDGVADEPLHLFDPPPARRWVEAASWGDQGAATNPPYGATLTYSVGPHAKSEEATLEIRDGKGRLVRTLSSTPEKPLYAEDDPDEPEKKPEAALSAEPGLHRASWDLRWQGVAPFERAKIDFGTYRVGPLAAPGVYALTLKLGEQTATSRIEVLPDPRSTVAPTELVAQQDAALALLDDIRGVMGDISTVRAVRDQVKELSKRLEGRADAAELRELAGEIATHCDRLEERLQNPKAQVVYDILAQKGGTQLLSNLVFVYETVAGGEGGVTEGAQEVWDGLRKEKAALHSELEQLLTGQVAELGRDADALHLPRIITPSD